MLFYLVAMLCFACTRQKPEETMSGKWNGYGEYLKTGEMVHTLWAGKNINIGSVTYGLDNEANFFVTYDCSSSGWYISATHLFAGDKQDMPLNKPGAPKIGHFPYSLEHNPRVSIFTYRIPLEELPPCAAPGFVVASHCIVHSPDGRTETAWAEGKYRFTDKGWGWYDDYYYNSSCDTFLILYGTACTTDSLKLFHLDITRGTAELILVEYVGNVPGNYDASAYDPESGMLFFSNYSTGELYINQLSEEGPSVCAGYLQGTAASATFYDQHYYYVNENFNTINKVSFTSGWMIAGEDILDTLPGLRTVNDIAMSPSGDILYLVSHSVGGLTELISWDVSGHTFYDMSVPLNEGAQIAFASNGKLYAIAPLSGEVGPSGIYSIDIQTDTLIVIEDDVIIFEDPFSDMSGGPL